MLRAQVLGAGGRGEAPWMSGSRGGIWVDGSGAITLHPFFSIFGSNGAWDSAQHFPDLGPVKETDPPLLGKWISRDDSVSPPVLWVRIAQHVTGVRVQCRLPTAASSIQAPGDLWLCWLFCRPHGLNDDQRVRWLGRDRQG